MKHAIQRRAVERRLVLRLETLRLVTAGDGDTFPVPPEQTRGSTATTCQSSKFNCC